MQSVAAIIEWSRGQELNFCSQGVKHNILGWLKKIGGSRILTAVANGSVVCIVVTSPCIICLRMCQIFTVFNRPQRPPDLLIVQNKDTVASGRPWINISECRQLYVL